MKSIIVDWEESFPWTIDDRMRGPGAFREEEVTGIYSVAAEASVELIPHLARNGLPLALDRVGGFARLSRFAATGEPADVAEAALRMVSRVLDDMLEIIERLPRLSLGTAPHAAESGVAGTVHRDRERTQRRYIEGVCDLLNGRGVELLSASVHGAMPNERWFRAAVPIEHDIAAALGLRADSGSQLAAEVLPVADALKRLDDFVDRAWRTLRCANEELLRASRDQGERHAFAANDYAVAQVECIPTQADALQAEIMPLLAGVMEPAVAATLLAARLSPVEELAAALRQRMRSLR